MIDTKSSFVYDARWVGYHGIGRHANEVSTRLGAEMQILRSGPRPIGPLEPLWLMAYLSASRDRTVVGSPTYIPPLHAGRHVHIPTVHDLYHLESPQEHGFKKAVYYRRVILPLLRKAPSLMTVSQHTADQLQVLGRIPAHRIHIIGNGLSEEFHPPGASPLEARDGAVALASNRPHKRFRVVVEALAEAQRRDSLSVTVVSGLGDSPWLAPLLERAGLCANVVTAPDDSVLGTLYRRAQVFVSGSVREGFGLPPVEAAACGTQVVITDIPAHRETLALYDFAEFVPTDDPLSMADAVAKACRSDPAPEEAAIGARTMMAAHNWTLTADAVRAVLRAHG